MTVKRRLSFARGRLPLLRVLLVAAGICLLATGPATARERKADVPFVLPIPQRTPERDDPPVVRRLLEREQQAAYARAKAASKLPRTREAGCVPVADPSGKTLLGPPAPHVQARIIGHQVEVFYRFDRLPESAACRPAGITVVVHSNNSTAPSGSPVPSVGDYFVVGPVGRLTLDLPWYTRAPYDLLVTSSTLLGYRSTYIRPQLACPRAGCLDGYSPPLHSSPLPLPLPQPVLPLAGLNRVQLEESLRYVISGERWPSARDAHCASLSSCTVTQATPGFPTHPYRIHYRMAGQQVRGCWMGLSDGPVDALPYPDAGRGPLELAGCRSWLR
jgi:hypothetical protein